MTNDNDFQQLGKDAGFSLTELAISLGLVSLIAIGIGQITSNYTVSSQKSMRLSDLDSIRHRIATYIDCDATFASAGIDANALNPGDCDSTSTSPAAQVAPFLQLHIKLKAGGTKDLAGSLEADGAVEIDGWRVTTSCSASEESLVIRAVPAHLSNPQPQDSRLLFGGVGEGVPLCFLPSP